tara:strand:+ start:181 stop:444 length:264 start_codon:yes stop_codon:yes gene_type:complete
LDEGDYKIQIKIKSKKYNLNQNEFWYFSFFLNKINNFYKIRFNKEKKILIKIPGTKKFSLIDKSSFKKLYQDIQSKISCYKDKYNYD